MNFTLIANMLSASVAKDLESYCSKVDTIFFRNFRRPENWLALASYAKVWVSAYAW